MSITATRVPSVPTLSGRRKRCACTRCGVIRQVNPDRASDLCADCRSTDPHVWGLKAAS